jgi:Na+-transporting methylmalonyl-CoA/oxaloacetate decarboxylase gamma subunit
MLAHSLMLGLTFDTAKILEHDGLSIALTGMTIVFIALSGISVFIACLPKILTLVGRYFPEADESAGHNPATSGPPVIDKAMVAALALAMQRQRSGNQR